MRITTSVVLQCKDDAGKQPFLEFLVRGDVGEDKRVRDLHRVAEDTIQCDWYPQDGPFTTVEWTWDETPTWAKRAIHAWLETHGARHLAHVRRERVNGDW